MENVALKQQVLRNERDILMSEMNARLARRNGYKTTRQPRKSELSTKQSVRYCQNIEEISYQGVQRLMRI